MKPLVLVTGAAAGRQGATGNRLVRGLLKMGFPVRAFVRADDERSESLGRAGAEVAIGDLLDIETVRAAMDGVGRAYFSYPIRDRLLEAAVNFAVAAGDSGVEAVLDLSMIPAAEGSPSPQARQHWLAERVFDWSGFGVVHLRAGFFYENLVQLCSQSVAGEGRLYFPFGEGTGKIAWVGAEDVAAASACILADPGPHLGKTLPLTGPEALTIREVADAFGRALSKEVEYVDIPLERWQRDLPRLEIPDPHLIHHLSVLSVALKNNMGFGQATDVFRSLTGERPGSMEEFIRANADRFGGPAR